MEPTTKKTRVAGKMRGNGRQREVAVRDGTTNADSTQATEECRIEHGTCEVGFQASTALSHLTAGRCSDKEQGSCCAPE